MSLESRSSSALFKRAEQLKRWEQSETNREPTQPRQIARKIKFSADCVFLAACAAGDKEEVVRLLQKGADINTGNVDGLTALHQACINDDLDMVEFLVEKGADINCGDNEGWTPLHATASCGFISIAKYLIEKGCNLAAVNYDGQLALDIAESVEMEDMLQQHISKAGIDCDQARSEEERSMLNDARAWQSGVAGKDSIHPKSGATALHVAAAKGYIDVMEILLQARCDVNAQDFDGWTPLHAAAHWGQLEACELLVENFCNMDIKNYADQTAFDIADTNILSALEELKAKQQLWMKDHPQIINKKQSTVPKKRISTNNENTITTQESVETFEEETPNKVKKVELEIQSDKEDSSGTNSDVAICISCNNAAWTEATRETDMEESDGEGESETSSDSHSSTYSNQSDKSNESNHSPCLTDDEKKNRANREETSSRNTSSTIDTNKVPNQAPIMPPKQQTDNEEGIIPSWRRSGSFRNRVQNTETTHTLSSRLEEKDKNIKSPTMSNKLNTEPDVVLTRTHSFETDEKFYEQYLALRARIKAFSCPTLHCCNAATPTYTNTTTRSASLRETHRRKEAKLNLELSRLPQGSNTLSPTSTSKTIVSSTLPTTTTATTTATTTTTTSPIPTNQIRSVQPVEATTTNNSVAVPGTPTTPGGSKLSPGNIFKNFFKSFVPPVRDEESETQRKAHAKRVRETRRSTQGVTLDEIKSAEQLVKKKQQNNEISSTISSTQSATTTSNTASITATITTATPTTVTTNKPSEELNLPERRPSWRLKVDNGSKFQLEDANNRTTTLSNPDTATYMRRPSAGSNVPRPSSAPIETIATSSAETTVTLPLRRSLKQSEDKGICTDKEQDKENDSRNAQATQAVIQRRRRPKRRSTGVVHVDMDEIDPEKQDLTAGGDCDESKINHNESGNDRTGRSNRLGSISSLSSEAPSMSVRIKSTTSENGELDYKKLYEESQAENERLKEKLRRSDEQLKETRNLLDKAQSAQNKTVLSEAEKRERRAMERKLSEMEEELKVMDQLKCENQRLKDENGALIRVISKLSK
ncbi:protein phosphatase 1 regulatory subunit 12A isoform X2 [Apis mellifera]|uniref:Protein phosphatase 1 regulatory subunit 12B n=1 Tax=Apis mellifera TaxID=7460 RepID=A0A7M7L1C8_APIME|nr:protein phosphatase 1 regulatory subunit 12A isoform X2 [Apis mellifera]|eukprot:XP_026295213.1 protein phosphatase 1 regulatory subunit 12A isoform X2 [Apis mellifera]